MWYSVRVHQEGQEEAEDLRGEVFPPPLSRGTRPSPLWLILLYHKFCQAPAFVLWFCRESSSVLIKRLFSQCGPDDISELWYVYVLSQDLKVLILAVFSEK